MCRGGTQPVYRGQSSSEVGDSPLPQSKIVLEALLDNIRSVHNTGSMFRTADGAALSHLYLCGMTATPTHPKLAKAALGAQHTVRWTHHHNGVETAATLKGRGYQLWAIEAGAQADALFAADLSWRDGPVVLIVGNERVGVDPGILAQCDRILSLPMMGQKRSLNAAVAFGIAAYFLRYALPARMNTEEDKEALAR